MAELLIDEGIGQDLTKALRAQGFRAFHALEFLPKGASDALVFLEAQRRALTVFTWNRDDYVLLAEVWRYWGHGAHHGVISRPIGQRRLSKAETYRVLERYCRNNSSFVDRIEMF
jgi:hypothetical protein